MHEPLQYLVKLSLGEFKSNQDLKYIIPKSQSMKEIFSIYPTSDSILNAVNLVKSNLVSPKQLTKAHIFTSGEYYK